VAFFVQTINGGIPMEPIADLLKQLATQLGTTAQYLWGVLIHQAPISATISLIQIVLIGIYGLILWKTHKYLLKEIPKEERSYDDDKNRYQKFEEVAVIPMVLGAIALITFTIIALCLISDVVNGYFNPEYWALQEILSKLKK
jgi:hypothetical protein